MEKQQERVVYCLVKANATTEEVDGMAPRTGYYCMRKEFPMNSPWVQVTVELSPKLARLIEKGATPNLLPGQEYVGTQYCSDNDSEVIHENPFRLKHFIPTGKSDIPEHYRLEIVNEAINQKEVEVHPLGIQMERWKAVKRELSEWRRYEQVKNTKKLSECSENLRIVPPEMMQ
jgi:hypothetical protein